MATAALLPSRTRAGRTAGYRWTLRLLALTPLLLTVGLGVELWRQSRPARQAFGWAFITGSSWNPVLGRFGAWPFIYGTLLTTALAVLLAAPLGVATAIFLAELKPGWLRAPLRTLVGLLVAVPSVVYGLWGIFVLAPWLQRVVEPGLQAHWGAVPLFQGAPYGLGYLAAGIILAIMIVPFVAGLGQQAITAVPRAQVEAAYALGCTRWEVIRGVVLPGARQGLWGGVLLATGRALGETMAVAMVIGNQPAVSASLFAPGYTLASAIANEFTEATNPLYTASLIELGLILFAITLGVNLASRFWLTPAAGARS